jgi:hypothetical protein
MLCENHSTWTLNYFINFPQMYFVIHWQMNWSIQLGIYTSPFVIWILHKKNFFCFDGFHSLMRFTAICTFLCASSLTARAFGRLSNPHYVKFINHLEVARVNYNSNTKVRNKWFQNVKSLFKNIFHVFRSSCHSMILIFQHGQ